MAGSVDAASTPESRLDGDLHGGVDPRDVAVDRRDRASLTALQVLARPHVLGKHVPRRVRRARRRVERPGEENPRAPVHRAKAAGGGVIPASDCVPGGYPMAGTGTAA